MQMMQGRIDFLLSTRLDASLPPNTKRHQGVLTREHSNHAVHGPAGEVLCNASVPDMQVLQGKIDILSSNGLDASIADPSTPGGIKAFSPESDPIVQYVNQQMEQFVKQMKDLAEEMQSALQHISDELATEVTREQQHLMLMQDQVQAHCNA